jgi:hypothetical protein
VGTGDRQFISATFGHFVGFVFQITALGLTPQALRFRLLRRLKTMINEAQKTFEPKPYLEIS